MRRRLDMRTHYCYPNPHILIQFSLYVWALGIQVAGLQECATIPCPEMLFLREYLNPNIVIFILKFLPQIGFEPGSLYQEFNVLTTRPPVASIYGNLFHLFEFPYL